MNEFYLCSVRDLGWGDQRTTDERYAICERVAGTAASEITGKRPDPSALQRSSPAESGPDRVVASFPAEFKYAVRHLVISTCAHFSWDSCNYLHYLPVTRDG